jgi:glycosyltransferase involved in cell wall biosynthesis
LATDEYHNQFCFLYSGTLGYKHNPELLLNLARHTSGRVVVLSEGKAVQDLKNRAEGAGIANLEVRSWVAYDQLAAALSSADVLVAMIEDDAGVYSVPSKILTYMCVGRPLLLSVPQANLAARLVVRAQAGLVSSPSRIDQFIDNALQLQADSALRDRVGKNARSYAERTFRIESIADRFENILERVARRTPARGQRVALDA